MSTNMPLRLLSYVSDILHLHVVDRDALYGPEQVMIPTPKFYVLYNGKQKLKKHELRLSDAFRTKDPKPSLELTAKIIDINVHSGEIALTRSANLHGYSQLIDSIRKNILTGMTRDMAISTAIDSCIDNDVLADFLTEHYLEVGKMLNWEYDADVEKRVIAEQSEQKGLKKGMKRGVKQGQQKTLELIDKLVKDGMSLDEALAKVRSTVKGTKKKPS